MSGEITTQEGTLVELPRHLYIPSNCRSIDIRKACNVVAGTTLEKLLSFTCPRGAQAVFIGYSLFNDGLYSSNTQFLPLVNGSRILPYHGDPEDNYKMSLGLSPDLSNLIQCYVVLNENDVLEWKVSNTSTVNAAMGVRMTGYFSSSQNRASTVIG